MSRNLHASQSYTLLHMYVVSSCSRLEMFLYNRLADRPLRFSEIMGSFPTHFSALNGFFHCSTRNRLRNLSTEFGCNQNKILDFHRD